MQEKKKIVRQFEKILQENKLNYTQAVDYFREARKSLGLTKVTTKHRDVVVPTNDEVKKFLRVVSEANMRDKIMMRLMLYVGLRSCEVVAIKLDDIDWTAGKERIFVHRKGGQDKYLPIPARLVDSLKLLVSENKEREFMFESKFRKEMSTRAVRYKFQHYRKAAGVSDRVHAHAFRAKLITFLIENGWSGAHIQKVSGHASVDSLRHYDASSFEKTRSAYNVAIDKFENDLA